MCWTEVLGSTVYVSSLSASGSWSSSNLALNCPQQKANQYQALKNYQTCDLYPDFCSQLFKNHTHTHTQCVHTKQKKTVLLWNALLIEGAVVPATIDQSMPGFDKSQKQKLGRECVCVSILHTHTNRHTCTATALYCCVLCGRLAHCGEMGAVKTLLEKRCWQTEGV